jgi:hypothetical protein
MEGFVVVSSFEALPPTGLPPYATSKVAMIRVNGTTPRAADSAKLRQGFASWSESAEERTAVLRERIPRWVRSGNRMASPA